jgi:hypothetical protein
VLINEITRSSILDFDISIINIPVTDTEIVGRPYIHPVGRDPYDFILGRTVIQSSQGYSDINYILYHDDMPIAAMIANVVETVKDDMYVQIKGISVHTKYRNMGVARVMYNYIRNHEKLNIMSDIKQTEAGWALWSKLVDTFTIRVMDIDTGEIISDDPNDAYKDYFNPDNHGDNLVLVTETIFREGFYLPEMNLSIT